MTLTEKEYHTYLKVHLDLLYHVGKTVGIFSESTTFHEFLDLDFSVKLQCRDHLLENKAMLDAYIDSRFDQLSSEEIAILAGYRRSISGRFIIFKCLNKHAIFYGVDEDRFYAVKALYDPFDELYDRFPILVETTILPFQGQIVYDGFLRSAGTHFSPRVTASMQEHYRRAKLAKEIVTHW